MSNELNAKTDPAESTVYQIRLKGHLGAQWAEWFGGLTLTLEDNGEMLLTGPVVDQAALHGLLKKVRDLGIPLLSVNQVQFTDTHLQQKTKIRSKKTERKPMKAFVFTEYGPPEVLQLKEVERPVPDDNQVLVKILAASVNPVDYHRMRGPLVIRLINRELRQPKTTSLGVDIAGRVEAVGRSVTQFQPSDAVFGVCSGGFAEYACAAESKLVLKPANVSFEAAAAVPVAAFTALQGLRDTGQIQAGQKVLIQGASGGVGTFAVQVAKASGAEVTAVCSPRNLEMARSIGADHVIDYTREDFTKNGQLYELILAVNGHHPILDYRKALSPRGILVVAGGSLSQVLQTLLLSRWLSRPGGKQFRFMGIAKTNQADLVFMKELLEAGKVVPVIDKCYPFQEVPEALRYLGAGHARGKVIITMDENSKT